MDKQDHKKDSKEKPTVVPPEERKLFLAYREKFMPAARLDGYDDFAKWLFTIAATVGALGAAFSSVAVEKLSGIGLYMYLGAVVLAGSSLALAVRSRSLDLPDASWDSLDEMFDALKPFVPLKRSLTRWSSGLLAGSLILASWAPIGSRISTSSRDHHPSFTYSIDGDQMRVSILLETTTPHEAVTAHIDANTDQGSTSLASVQAVSDAHRVARLDMVAKSLPHGVSSVTVYWPKVVQGSMVEERTVLSWKTTSPPASTQSKTTASR
jgi:hypothetical protein